MQPDNTRPPEPADTPEGSEDESTAFDPGDSFSNSPSDIGDPGELPSWLRNFAGTASEPNEPAAPSSEPERVNTPAPMSWDASDAGSTAETAAAAAPDAAPMDSAFSAGADSGFFSEDDLPEWLRALSLDGQAASDSASDTASSVDQVTPGGAMSVPQVSRAWVTPSDVPEVSVGANLLSSLVTVVDSRPDVVAVEAAAPVTHSPNAVAKAAATKPPAPPVAATGKPQAETLPGDVAEPATATSEGWSRTTILLIVAIIILLIVLILFLS